MLQRFQSTPTEVSFVIVYDIEIPASFSNSLCELPLFCASEPFHHSCYSDLKFKVTLRLDSNSADRKGHLGLFFNVADGAKKHLGHGDSPESEVAPNQQAAIPCYVRYDICALRSGNVERSVTRERELATQELVAGCGEARLVSHEDVKLMKKLTLQLRLTVFVLLSGRKAKSLKDSDTTRFKAVLTGDRLRIVALDSPVPKCESLFSWQNTALTELHVGRLSHLERPHTAVDVFLIKNGCGANCNDIVLSMKHCGKRGDTLFVHFIASLCDPAIRIPHFSKKSTAARLRSGHSVAVEPFITTTELEELQQLHKDIVLRIEMHVWTEEFSIRTEKHEIALTSPNKQLSTGTTEVNCCVCHMTVQQLVDLELFLQSTECGHLICSECTATLLAHREMNCPICRTAISAITMRRLYI